MGKEYLVEQFTIDCSQDIKKRDDLMESLENNKIKVEVPVNKKGKTVMESREFEVSSVYRVPISRPGIKNKNKRTYTLEKSWNPVLEKGMGEGSLGLLNHPKPGESPDITKAACVWRNHKVETADDHNPIVRADMYLLKDDKGNGQFVESIINAGGKVDLSTRGYGEIDEGGVVYNYDYKSTDIVYEGSYGVQASGDDRYNEKEVPNITEDKKEEVQGDEKSSKMDSKTTNNKIEIGETPMMNKVVLNRLIEESLNRKNKFKAYTELVELNEGIKDNEDFKEIRESLTKHIVDLKPTLEAEYQGDAKNDGSADDPKMRKHNATDPEKKIKDTDEKEPDDVDSIQIEPVKDTPDSERTGKTGIKAASSPDSMAKEVKSGEISAVNQGIKEDTDEEEPDDVKQVQVKAVKDTDKRPAYTDTKAGTGKPAEKKEDEPDNSDVEKIEDTDLSKLTKDELIDVIGKMNEATKELQNGSNYERAMYETLAEQYLKLESYTLKAEKVVEMDKGNKEKAQLEVTESVTLAEELKEEYDAIAEKIVEQQEYIEKLEDIVVEGEKAELEEEKVIPYVNRLLEVNLHLIPYSKEIKKAKSIKEAIELAEKYNSLRGKVRLDKITSKDIITEDNDEKKVKLTEGKSYLKQHNWI